MDVSQAGRSRDAEDDGAITPQQLIAELMTAIHSIGSQTKFAAKKGVSQSLVSLTVTGKRGIDESIANALGYIKRVKVEYVPIRQGTCPATLTQHASDARPESSMGEQQPRTGLRHGVEQAPGDDPSFGDGLSPAIEPRFETGGAARHHGNASPGGTAAVARVGA